MRKKALTVQTEKKKGEDFLNVSYVTIMQDKTWVYCKSVTVAENLIQAYGVCLPGCWKQRQSKSHRCTSRLCCGVCIFCQRRETFRAIFFAPLSALECLALTCSLQTGPAGWMDGR